MSIKILLIAMGSLMTVFPIIEVLTKWVGAMFVGFCPIRFFIPSQVFFYVSQLSSRIGKSLRFEAVFLFFNIKSQWLKH